MSDLRPNNGIPGAPVHSFSTCLIKGCSFPSQPLQLTFLLQQKCMQDDSVLTASRALGFGSFREFNTV